MKETVPMICNQKNENGHVVHYYKTISYHSYCFEENNFTWLTNLLILSGVIETSITIEKSPKYNELTYNTTNFIAKRELSVNNHFYLFSLIVIAAVPSIGCFSSHTAIRKATVDRQDLLG